MEYPQIVRTITTTKNDDNQKIKQKQATRRETQLLELGAINTEVLDALKCLVDATMDDNCNQVSPGNTA